MAEVAVLGAGSWGTALAVLLASKGERVRLWDRSPEVVRGIEAGRRNPRYLSDVAIPEDVRATGDLLAALDGADVVVFAVPCDAVHEVAGKARAPLLGGSATIVSAAKGLERTTGQRMTQLLEGLLGPPAAARILALSGPNLAIEICRGIPTATVVAGADPDRLREVQHLFNASRFRVYTNPDTIGVELGGALKNVIAIGAGITDGLGFGENTKGSLLTRGLAEITRLGVSLGARAETFQGLSGLGDLVATCASRHSRNWRVGEAIARGQSLPTILAEMGMVAEGVPTAHAVMELAGRIGVEMPICEQVHAVLFEGKPPLGALGDLMNRALKDEG